MPQYQTPGVYIEEINNLPMSIVAAPATIPAFIGTTQKCPESCNGLVKINSLAEYIELFGKADEQEMTFKAFKVIMDNDNVINVQLIKEEPEPEPDENHLYYHLKLYFANGGGACYISVVKGTEYGTALEQLEIKDEISLIVLSAVKKDPLQEQELVEKALTQCKDLNRFLLLDTDYKKEADVIKNFRSALTTTNLAYAAAYTPYLNTSFNYQFSKYSLLLTGYENEHKKLKKYSPSQGVTVYCASDIDNDQSLKFADGYIVTTTTTDNKITFEVPADTSIKALIDAWSHASDQEKQAKGLDSLAIMASDKTQPITGCKIEFTTPVDVAPEDIFPLACIKTLDTGLYHQVKDLAIQQRVINMPPGAAMAGLYCKQARERGIWQSPANISLNAVTGPSVDITEAQQGALNIDAETGKSINAIRYFSGQGTLVWGARTLAGNDNNWRYISVRRTFSYVERSIKTALQSYVFEPNTAMTWLKIETMINSFLTDLWQQGGLAGSTAEDAFFINLGLGKSMTDEDILQGRLKISIGLAAVRPAEFIIVEFSQRLQK